MSQEQKASSSILYLYDDLYLEHITRNHPECPNRLKWINTAINHSSVKDKMHLMRPRPALKEDILRIHTDEYLSYLEEEIENGSLFLDMDTHLSPRSLDAAYLAAGAGLVAADEIIKGNFKVAFCAVRPPGHHAEKSQAMGFCIFNNIAITAKYLQEVHGIKKILILDWDVHHGNGTEHSFYRDNSVYYISLHQWPHFPGTGLRDDVGEGAGKGYNLNIPMDPGMGDGEYLLAFEQEVLPAIRKFAPDFILLSVGFDGHHKDLYSSINLKSETYGIFTEMVKSVADTAQGRIISFLEGGYDPIGLTEGVLYHLKML